jgi:hypothetical protein
MANRLVTKDVSDSQIASAVLASFPMNKLDRILEASAAHGTVIFKGSNLIPLRIADYWFLGDTDTNISTAADMDAGAISNGKDYYVYACYSAGSLVFKISLASTWPAGFDATNSRKIGGFHTLCVNVGAIAGHTLTGYVANDILPASVWDLKHRARGRQTGKVFCAATNTWVDIYLLSGVGAASASVYNANISDDRDWMDFVDDVGATGDRLAGDGEFQVFAAGSNEETNVAGSVDPVTTGGKSDTAGRRMISNFGIEDCCGSEWQWLKDQSYQCNPDGTVQAAALLFTVLHDNAPGGNVIYLKQSVGGAYYLASNLAAVTADRYIGSANYKIPIKYEAAPAVGAINQIYFDDDATQPGRLLCNIATILKPIYIPTNNPTYFVQVTHDVNAAANGVALYYDDGADNRLEANNASGIDQSLDLVLNSQSWAYYNLPGVKGSLYRQGTYGDVKLLAGGSWYGGTNGGSRGRYANISRWNTDATIGARAVSEPL